MSEENVELVRRGYVHRQATGEFLEEIIAPDFVWDMSTFRGWPEQQLYEGIDEARAFITNWLDAFDDWKIEVETLHDAGEKVVAVVRQWGTAKSTGLTVDMRLAQVYTVKDGLETRMEMYADPAAALKVVGLEE
jgi:ketosteroid isomerase-like protein